MKYKYALILWIIPILITGCSLDFGSTSNGGTTKHQGIKAENHNDSFQRLVDNNETTINKNMTVNDILRNSDNQQVTEKNKSNSNGVDDIPVIGSIENEFEDISSYKDINYDTSKIYKFNKSVYNYTYYGCGGEEDVYTKILSALTKIVDDNQLDIDELLCGEGIGYTEDSNYDIYRYSTVKYSIKIAINIRNFKEVKYIIEEV